jgi:DNA modification methylase
MSKEKQPKDPAKQGEEIKTAADLKQDGNNYRKHSDTNKARIKKSIDEAGLGRSVLIDADGVLVAGNGVQQVIDKDTPVRVVETDGTELVVVKRTDLHTDDPRRKTLALADNATSDEVEWDTAAMEADGWDADSAGEWGVEWPADEEEGKQQEAQEDDFDPDKPVETVCKKGDIWKLGNHRLMCGDSTDAASVALLMDGEKADITFTSPPYNMAVTQLSDKCPNRAMHNGKAYNSYDDNKSDADYTKLLEGALKNCLNHTDDVLFNIGILKASKIGIISMMSDFRDKFCDIIVWNKSQSMPLGLPSHVGCVSHRCELIFCFNQDGSRAFSHPQWSHGAQINRIDTENASSNEFAKVHAATFPVALPFKVIESYTEKSVLDVFGGTGTTLIAAEQLGRKCYMMELDPHYCDVIIARWEKLTGNKAEKLE